ncbi:MAG: tRNA preQ1(34) S-adenosylmethionine ribosyltransferase-isomerase QueA [Tissierellia bacterium]|nr:tRNA preQ1(34) S-adenosylmethionine ribosyltransferase-isomerase QueA [Tissierellia bacterium]
MLKKSDFYFELPPELIAQTPIEKRDESRLLVINKEKEKIEHKKFRNIIDYLSLGDTLVINETKVMPGRIYGKRPGKEESIEVLLLKREGDIWDTLVKPGKKMKIGTEIEFSDNLKGTVVDIKEDGLRRIEFVYSGIFEEILDKIGQMPLPPYIHEKLEDKSRYQTVYAKDYGSSAAPTAGLHFTKDVINDLEKKGINIAKLTLHVGLGTFRPVKEDNILDHKMHEEYYYLSEDNAEIINETINRGKKIIAVGTTSVRTLESIYKKHDKIISDSGSTDIFIYPGYKFKVIDGLVTNFHLPESTLLMLISAFWDREKILSVYQEAINERYRFFSFGDAMFIY